MSRKRYSQGSQRGSPHQGKQRSTSIQQASYDYSLAADCLIRTFMEKGDMQDSVLKMLFIGRSRPRENKTENDLLFRRMKTCWMEKGKNYGMKEFLKSKMREAQIETEIDGRWAKFSLMGALLIINPKIWVTKQGEERRFLKDFQLEKFRDDRILSEGATIIQRSDLLKHSYDTQMGSIPGQGSNMIIYADSRTKDEYFLVEVIQKRKGVRQRYYKTFQNNFKGELKKIVSRMNRILRSQGPARLSIDEKMICPFCIETWNKIQIFKHSYLMSADLMHIKRGRRQ